VLFWLKGDRDVLFSGEREDGCSEKNVDYLGYQTISGMNTERRNIASRLIMKAIKAGSLGGCFVQTDIDSKDCLAQ